FLLHSVTKKGSGGLCDTTWKVEETYDFEDFKGGPSNWKLVSKWSEFPFRGHRVRVYDGLSRYLVHLGMAKEFDYYATWMEHWKY
ncbi:MAG TPA: hypothetical protein VK639_09095, partial [Terriglobales bacterium]|nr:hypothetical protein [Terriglobales bacterium]